MAQIRAFAKDDSKKLLVEKKINFKGFLLDTFILNKASSLSFALLLATRKPKSLLDGTAIDMYKALSIVNKLEYHHVFPKEFLMNRERSKTEINYHANICMLNLSSNREISNEKPSVYFGRLEKTLGDKLEMVLESNFMNEETFKACLADDYDNFVDTRMVLLTKDMESLVDVEVL